MTLKEFSYLSAATKLEIAVAENDNLIETAIIDYLENKEYKRTHSITVYPSFLSLPDYIKESNVELVDGMGLSSLYIIVSKAR